MKKHAILRQQLNEATAGRAYAPHCDQRILHAPGLCKHCDAYPDWQQARHIQGIAFTGQVPTEDQLTCPSEFFRTVEAMERWGGNRRA